VGQTVHLSGAYWLWGAAVLASRDILSINGCQLQSLVGNYAVFEEKAAEYRRFHEHIIYDNRQREEARQHGSAPGPFSPSTVAGFRPPKAAHDQACS
jgi:hypothetical protein